MVKQLNQRLNASRAKVESSHGLSSSGGRWSPSRSLRFALMLFTDLCLVCLALTGSASLGYNRPLFPANTQELLIFLGILCFAATVFVGRRLYRSLIRHMGPDAVWDLVGAVTLVALSFALATFYLGFGCCTFSARYLLAILIFRNRWGPPSGPSFLSGVLRARV